MDNSIINNDDALRALEQKESGAPVPYDEKPNLGISESARQAQERMDQPMMAGMDGWKMIPLENLPSKAMFYPEGMEIAIKAASVGEIRQFSMIDETDPLDMDDKLNVVMDKCVRIRLKTGLGSYRDLKEEDRFFLIFAIRDLTFITGENKLFMNMKCGIRCNGDGTYNEKIELRSENFEYYNIEDQLMEFYDPNELGFVLPFPDGPVKLYVPSLGVTTFIKNFVRERQAKGEYFDKMFLKFASFMFKDYRMLNETSYLAKQQESMTWDNHKLSAIIQATEMIRFGVKLQITRSCNKCGAEVAAPLTFPGGIRSLFLISNPLARLR